MRLLTIKEASAAIRMSEGYLRAAIRSKQLLIIRLGKVRGVRIRPEDLERFVSEKIEGTLSSFKGEMAALAKMESELNQWVTPRDNSRK